MKWINWTHQKTGFPSTVAITIIVAIWLVGCGILNPAGKNKADKKGASKTSQTESAKPLKSISYPANFTFTEVPKPLSGGNKKYALTERSAPAVGKTFRDDRFRTYLTRVTQKGKIRHEYSRHDPFNSDQSMIILQDIAGGEYRVFQTDSVPYEQRTNRVRTLGLEEPRWDPSDPNQVWGSTEFSIVAANVRTGKTKTVKDFSKDKRVGPIIKKEKDLYRITMRDEGESSTDKRFWAVALQGSKDDDRLRYIITWDRRDDEVLGVYDIPENESEIDWVGMSPEGTWVLIGGDAGNGKNLDGLVMANLELTEFHQLDHGTGHADVGLDSDGNEVIVMQNSQTDYIDLIPIDMKTKPVSENRRYTGTNRTRLMRLYYDSESKNGFNSGVHISCNVPGYCVVSTHIEPHTPEQNWLDRTIVLIKLDRQNPRVFYLAKIYNTTQEYWEETHATITNDGSKLIWASNWGQDVGAEDLFVMQLDMPSNWTDLTE